MSTSTRIFSFGLGHSPSRSLVKGLARATNGRFVFVAPNTKVDIHVAVQLQKALQPSITGVQVKWNLGTSVTSAPTKLPPVYVNDRLIVYALADDPTVAFDPQSTVELFTEKVQIAEARVRHEPDVASDGTIGRLAAKALILELQHSKLPQATGFGSLQGRFQTHTEPTTVDEKEITKRLIVELSLKHNILSPHTAFVGIERRKDGNNAVMVLREVPREVAVAPTKAVPGRFAPRMVPMCDYRLVATHSRRMSSMQVNACLAPSRNMPMSNYTDSIVLLACRKESFSQRSTPTSTVRQSIMDKLRAVRRLFRTSSDAVQEPVDSLDQGDKDIVRRLISEQQFDGRWNLDSTTIQQLTGKPLASFSPSGDQQVVISAIVIVALETRFASFSAMWYGVVQKARKCLLDLLGKDEKKLHDLLEHVRQQLG